MRHHFDNCRFFRPRIAAPVSGLFITLFFNQAFAQTLSQSAIEQLTALSEEKLSRTPAQQKLDSHLHYAGKITRGQPLPRGFTARPASSFVPIDSQGSVLVDIRATVNPALLTAITALGGQVISSSPNYQAIRANLPLL